jgi:response regulator RpfG family c-di-GMP phosphodiesterase
MMTYPTRHRTAEPDAAHAAASARAGTGATVLCVDDEPGILAALKRCLRLEGLAVLTATGGEQALEILRETPVDLVISDMRMPGMDGAQLLERIHAEWPGTVRVLLTGHSDPASTVAAVNRGQIFRYLHKPWGEEELIHTVREGLALAVQVREDMRLMSMAAAQNGQLRQLNEELQQLQERNAAERRHSEAARQRQYLQSVKVLTNLMEVRCIDLFEHGRRVATLARDLARGMDLSADAVLDVFVAGLLHDIALIGPAADGSSHADAATDRAHPAQSARALAAMEDMLPVARLVEAHHERFDGTGFPSGSAGAAIPLGARILAVADAVDDHRRAQAAPAGHGDEALLAFLHADGGRRFDPAVVAACIPLLRARAN